MNPSEIPHIDPSRIELVGSEMSQWRCVDCRQYFGAGMDNMHSQGCVNDPVNVKLYVITADFLRCCFLVRAMSVEEAWAKLKPMISDNMFLDIFNQGRICLFEPFSLEFDVFKIMAY